MKDEYVVRSEEELDSIIGEPQDLIKQKVCASLDDSMTEFIARSPLIFLSTVDSSGLVDTSPKGDAPGFVHVDESGVLLIPDRPGNKLMFGFKNILHNDSIGVIFVVPTMRETLRVKGRAVISRDPALLDELSARGKPALLCTRIQIEECFFHCGKAMIRSRMWQPEHWATYEDALLVRQLSKTMGGGEELEKLVADGLEENYRDELY